MNSGREAVELAMKEVLLALSREELTLFSAVFRKEQEYLGQKNPQLGPEITKLVRQIIK
jgi:hypothetical protein